MRLFIGLPLTSTACEELANVTSSCKPTVEGFRWTSPEAWHITLQFLGNTKLERLQCLASTLRGLNSPAIPIQMGELSFFERAGALVVEVFPSPELVALQVAVVQATVPCGFVPEERSFRPHITLARSKNKSAVQAKRTFETTPQKAPTFSPFVAGEFRLYESFLGTNGSRYEVRERFLLDTSLRSSVG